MEINADCDGGAGGSKYMVAPSRTFIPAMLFGLRLVKSIGMAPRLLRP